MFDREKKEVVSNQDKKTKEVTLKYRITSL